MYTCYTVTVDTYTNQVYSTIAKLGNYNVGHVMS